MSLWTMADVATGDKPKNLTTAEKATCFGVSEAEVATAAGKFAHGGWVDVKQGTGGVVSVTIGSAGTGKTDGSQAVTFSAGGATGTATVSGGAVTAITITSAGTPLATAPTVTVAGSGTGGVFTAVLGGRAGRTFRETLVAGGITSGDQDAGTVA